VGGVPIYDTRHEAEFQRALRVRERTGVPVGETWQTRKRQELLNELIGDELVLRAMRDRSTQVTESDVDARIERKIQTTFKTRRVWKRHLSKMGQTTADYRRGVKIELGVEGLAEDASTYLVSEEELQAFYRERRSGLRARSRVDLAMIVLRVRRSATAADRATMRTRAYALASAARRGDASFEDLARRYSDGPTAASGGRLGWVFASNLDPRVARKVFREPIGTITEPVSTKLGFQIAKIYNRRDKGIRELDEVRGVLRAQLGGRKARDVRGRLVTALRRVYAVTVADVPGESVPVGGTSLGSSE
jgi:parvulin-like peptidyl-prolyl isomerase